MLASAFIYLGIFLWTILNYRFANRCLIKGLKKDGFRELLIKFFYIFTPIVLLYGLRYDVGVDYRNYLRSSRLLLANSKVDSYYEFGYIWLNRLSNFIFNNEYAIFTLSGIVIFAVLFVTLQKGKKELDVVLAVYIFLMVYFGMSCNIVRQIMASVILLYGCQYIIKGNWKKYIVCILFASAFHSSVILCAFFWFVRLFKTKHIFYFKILIILSSMIILFFPQLIYQFANWYGYGHLINKSGSDGIAGITFLLYVIPILLIIEFYKKELLKKDYRYNYLVALMYVQIPFQMGGYINREIERFSIYSSILQVILVPTIINAIENSKKRKLALLITKIWYLIYFVVMNVIRDGYSIIPYQTWIFK